MKNQTSKLGVIATENFSATLSDYQIDLKQNWHCHDEFILVMLLRGNVREQVKCEDTLINAFDVGIKAPDIKHTDYFCPKGVRVIRLSLAPKFIEELKSQSLINEGWYWLRGSNAVRPFLRIGQSLLLETSDTEDNVYEVLASLLPNQESPQKSHPPFWLRRAKNHLDETYHEGVRLSQLAIESGVHPVYFARKFQYFFGCSVGGYIRKLQFRKVHNLLMSDKLNLSQIAAEVGFSDQSHLTRTLNTEFGITPANLRKLLK